MPRPSVLLFHMRALTRPGFKIPNPKHERGGVLPSASSASPATTGQQPPARAGRGRLRRAAPGQPGRASSGSQCCLLGGREGGRDGEEPTDRTPKKGKVKKTRTLKENHVPALLRGKPARPTSRENTGVSQTRPQQTHLTKKEDRTPDPGPHQSKPFAKSVFI